MSTDPAPETGPAAKLVAPVAMRRAMRREGIERRLALSSAQSAVLSATICHRIAEGFPRLAECRVGFCWPIKNEPDIRPLLRTWLERSQPGFAALLPVVISEAAPLAFRRWVADTPMSLDRYGIPTPERGEFEEPEALLIPVNAFDAEGYRIGYGGGFFDRTIAALARRPICIGVGFELARVASTYPQAHDIRLDAIVTENGVFPALR